MKPTLQLPAQRSMIVAGVMSGTSADGVDVALCRIAPTASALTPRLRLLAHHHVPYTRSVRSAVLAAMDARRTSTAELSRLHWRLGSLYTDAVAQTLTRATSKLHPQLIALHGQTLYHQAAAQPYLGAPTRCTWQAGEASVLAEHFAVPVVSDFRAADLAAGGQAAPLVPMFDFVMFRHATRNRLLLNLGGIANITALPAGCDASQVMAFDTGPANMVVDALVQRLYSRPYDRGGRIAARGVVLQQVVEEFSQQAYFVLRPPKSCGREQFGEAFVMRFLAACRTASRKMHRSGPQLDADTIATATDFTARTIADAYARFAWPHFGQTSPLARGTDLIAAGGGTENPVLMRLLSEAFTPFGIRLTTTTASGIPSSAKEAAAFALLGWLTWHRLPGNLVSATGAAHPAILGKVTYA
jgi:anhydro-N-acetylmuramic acid kinase